VADNDTWCLRRWARADGPVRAIPQSDDWSHLARNGLAPRREDCDLRGDVALKALEGERRRPNLNRRPAAATGTADNAAVAHSLWRRAC
jgi:hypothetical protein